MKTNRQQLLVIGTIVVAAIFLGDKVIVSPLSELWTKRKVRITRLEQDLADGRVTLKREQWTLKDWQKIRSNSLPADRARAEVLLQNAVDRWEQESKIKIAGRKFQERTYPDEEYATIECALDASGTLETISRFLYQVEKEPLPVRVEDLKITAKDNDGRELLVGLRVSGLMIQSKE